MPSKHSGRSQLRGFWAIPQVRGIFSSKSFLWGQTNGDCMFGNLLDSPGQQLKKGTSHVWYWLLLGDLWLLEEASSTQMRKVH